MADRLDGGATLFLRERTPCGSESRSVALRKTDVDYSSAPWANGHGCAQASASVAHLGRWKTGETVRKDRAAQIDGLAARAHEHERCRPLVSGTRTDRAA